jgi:hypothetical protein
MAEKSIDSKKSQEAGESTGTTAATKPLFATPIILKRTDKKGNRKKKYSRGTKGLQRLFLGVSKAGYRVADSASDGLRVFNKRSKRSGRKKRDGLVRDSLRNLSRGFSKGTSQFGRAPEEIAKRISLRRTWRSVRVLTPLG